MTRRPTSVIAVYEAPSGDIHGLIRDHDRPAAVVITHDGHWRCDRCQIDTRDGRNTRCRHIAALASTRTGATP